MNDFGSTSQSINQSIIQLVSLTAVLVLMSCNVRGGALCDDTEMAALGRLSFLS